MNDLFHQIADQWWHWMAGISVQVTIVAVVVAALDKLLRRWVWPQLLLALWMIVAIRLLVPPTFTAPWTVAQVVPQATDVLSMVVKSQDTIPPSNTFSASIFCVWTCTVLACGFVALQRYRTQRRRWEQYSKSTPSSEFEALLSRACDRLSISKLPVVILGEDDVGPAAFGFFSPTIRLPRRFVENGPADQVEHVLLHELAHIRRKDSWLALLCMAVQILYWFHPLVWMMRRRISTLVEICCDHNVAEALSQDAPAYRGTLLELARPLLKPQPAWQLGFVTPRSQLLQRLDWLSRRRGRFALVGRLTTAALICLISVFALPVSQSAAEALPAVAPFVSAPAKDSVAELIEYANLKGSLQKKYFILNQMAQRESSDPQTLAVKENSR